MAARLEKRTKDGVTWYVFPELERLTFLTHWITGREGGVSAGELGGFNLGGHVGDDPANVTENRRQLQETLTDGRKIHLPEQVHSATVVGLTKDGQPSGKCDAITVNALHLPAGVLTADCIPIILADPVRRGAAVIHAGRLGVFENILNATVEKMKKELGTRPADLVAAIGPGIRECCYRVQGDVFKGYERYREYLTMKGTLDLTGALEDQMVDAGLRGERILDCGVCTSCRTDLFFSHRRQEGKAGRFMTGVMLKQPDSSPLELKEKEDG